MALSVGEAACAGVAGAILRGFGELPATRLALLASCVDSARARENCAGPRPDRDAPPSDRRPTAPQPYDPPSPRHTTPGHNLGRDYTFDISFRGIRRER